MHKKSTTPLRNIESSVLAELDRLDLSDRITFDEIRVVSAGGYGDISKARCTLADGSEPEVAVKRLRFHIPGDIKLLFEREIYVWSKLKHDNILPLLGFAFDTSGYPLLISEWMANGSALAYIKRNPDCDVMHLTLGIARGLAYLHEKDIVHSDIKSENVLVSYSGDALLCDFGCSRMIAASRTFVQMTPGIRGTVRYMACELFLPLANNTPGGVTTGHTKETDVWAFGMTVFELLSRQCPYAGYRPDPAVIGAIVRGEVPTFPEELSGSLQPDTADFLKGICHKCWNHEPQSRPSISDVLARFERWIEYLPLREMPSEFQLVIKAFECVTEYLKRMIDMPGGHITSSTVMRYCEKWDALSQDCELTIKGIHHISKVAAQYIDDFVKNYCVFLALDFVAVETKIEQLELFREELCGIFGENAKELTGLVERVILFKADVSAFASDLRYGPPNAKNSVEDSIEQIQCQLKKNGSDIQSLISIRDITLASQLGDAQALILIDSLLNEKTLEQAKLETQRKEKYELKAIINGNWMQWANTTSECCEQVDSIMNHLDAIKHFWMAICADSEALMGQLMFMSQYAEESPWFERRLKNIEEQYRAVYDVFYKFTHHTPIPATPPPPPPLPPSPPHRLTWFSFDLSNNIE